MTGGIDLFKVAARSAYERVSARVLAASFPFSGKFGRMLGTKFTKVESETKQNLRREINKDFGIC